MDGSNFAPARPSLLLVDDCIAQRDMYEAVLASEFEVVTADRGDEGIALASTAHPDAIVLDIAMPGMDGWETCTRIKRNDATADIPIILLTGSDDSDLREHAAAVGASAILTKPCPAERLCDTIRGALNDPPRKVVWADNAD
jgi:CheY-like chemotaxis protein